MRSMLTAVALLAACSNPEASNAPVSPAHDAMAAADASEDECRCSSGVSSERIYLLSQHGELYSYAPGDNSFRFESDLQCAGASRPFSMALDITGQLWILYADGRRLFRVDVQDSYQCTEVAYERSAEGFALFGMSFTGTGADSCKRLLVQSYTGEGPFAEGPGIGKLGELDLETGALSVLASIDFDGGELAGSGDGRLISFTGNRPAKLVELNRDTGETFATYPLPGFSKTNASAMALYGGDAYLFSEAQPAGCKACLQAECEESLAECNQDPSCAQQMACAIEQADIDDECGGPMPPEMHSCLAGACVQECLPPLNQRKSQVIRVDLDQSEGLGLNPQIVHAEAPIRIVGAANSPCVPFVPE